MRKNRGSDIHLYIERLILEGLPVERAKAVQVQMAVEAELTRLFAENGLAANFQAGGAVPSIRAAEIQLAPDSSPAQMGTQIAQSIYSGIGKKK